MHDTKSGIFVAITTCRKYPTIEVFSGDGGYRGSFIVNVQNILDCKVEISTKIVSTGFHVIPNRWKVERTFAWLGNSRRLAKDFERNVATAETMIKISHFHMLLKRL